MKYILSGDDKTVQNVLKENRIRIKRGLLSITPLDESESEGTEVKNDNDFVDNGDDNDINGDDKIVTDDDKKDIIEGVDTKKVVESDEKEIAEGDEKKPRGRKKKEE